jgi:endonuclease/exonuclease/phosphatase (EEP) superfamily protein YafD
VVAAGSVVGLFTLAGFFGEWFWMFELTSHFRVQYAVLLGLATIILGIRRKWRATLLFATFTSINTCLLIPLIPALDRHSNQADNSIRLLAWNVNSQNTRYDELTRLISEHDPDLVLAMEVNQEWERHIRSLTNFPNQHAVPRNDNFGIALISRLDAPVSETLELGEAGVPSILTTLPLNGRWLSILSTHPLPPAGSQYSRMRNEQLHRVADWSNAQTNAVIVLGDLNVTPWSPVFSGFTERTRLVNSAEGRGFHGTWPSGFPLMRIPIDHFLHSTNIVVTRREVLETTGSDHLAQLLEFTIE